MASSGNVKGDVAPFDHVETDVVDNQKDKTTDNNEACVKADSKQSKSGQQQNTRKVDFYLHVLEHRVAAVNLKLDYLNTMQQMVHMEKVENGDLWHLSLCVDNIDKISYNYHFTSKHFLKGNCEEDYSRCLKENVRAQYDTSFLPNDKKYISRTRPQSCLFYAKWLLGYVNDTTIVEILKQIGNGLSGLNVGENQVQSQLRKLTKWLIEAINDKLGELKCFYLAIILANICVFDFNRKIGLIDMISRMDSTKADSVLQALCQCKTVKLSATNMSCLSTIAPCLVEASSSPGWLTFAVHFLDHLGINVVLEHKFKKQECNDEQYVKLMNKLPSSINSYSKKSPWSLFSKIFHIAPSEESVYHFIDCQIVRDIYRPLNLGIGQFFEKIFSQLKNDVPPSSSHLADLAKIPVDILREREMGDLIVNTLGFYLKLKCKPNEECLKNIVKLTEVVHGYRVYEILLKLVKSENQDIRNLVLQLLNCKSFYKQWNFLGYDQGYDVCSQWIIQQSKTAPKPEINVYECVTQIISCTLIAEEPEFVKCVCGKFVDKLVDHFPKGLDILKEHKVLEKYKDVQKLCIDHLEKVISDVPSALKMFLEAYEVNLHSYTAVPVLSRFSERILLCILNKALKLEITVKPFDARAVEKIVDQFNVWKILFSVTGPTKAIQKSDVFARGSRLLTNLAQAIESGDISINALDEIIKSKQQVSFILAKVTRGDEKKIGKQIRKLKKNKDDFFSKSEVIGKFLVFASGIGPCSKSAETLLNELRLKKEQFSTQKISVLNDDEMWGDLSSLTKPAVDFEHYVMSKCFAKEVNKLLENTKFNSSQTNNSFMDIPNLEILLNENAIEHFRAQWIPHLSDENSLSTKTMKLLVGDLAESELEKEFEALNVIFNDLFTPKIKEYWKGFVRYPSMLNEVNNILALVKIFDVKRSVRDNLLCTFEKFAKDCSEGRDVKLKVLSMFVKDIDTLLSTTLGKDYNKDLLDELSRSTELVSFIKEIKDKDIRYLTDAVEEYSDRFISASVVSEFIDVHRFIKLLRGKEDDVNDDLKTFLSRLSHQPTTNLLPKLKQCNTNVNSLKGLHKSVAKRGDMTKEIITTCLKEGYYVVAAKKDKSCDLKMCYKKKEQEIVYNTSQLHDLRSRAHLIVSSAESKPLSSVAGNSEEINFSEFISQVNLSTEIANLLLNLQYSGHTKYRNFKIEIFNTDDLKNARNYLMKDLESWEEMLYLAQKQHYFLNYYRSDQLCILYDFFSGKEKNDPDTELMALVKLVCPNVKESSLKSCVKSSSNVDSPENVISIINEALENISVDFVPVSRNMTSSTPSNQAPFVEAGELFVARLEKHSSLTVNVMLELYQNTTNSFPEAHQVLFCSSETTWEDVQLLLQRCFYYKSTDASPLFCIANVEVLSNKVQFEMVNMIKKKMKRSYSRNDVDVYRLILICCGGEHHHIIEEFSEYSHHTTGISDKALSCYLKLNWPNVVMVTSSYPGLGKTEYIRKEAQKKKKNIVTFPLSGPFNENDVIQRLTQLKLKTYQCLHLDINEVNNPVALDIFLFRLIVIGVVSSGAKVYHNQTSQIYIEVANTLNDSLRESLLVSKSFSRVDLMWKDSAELLASCEVTSNVQVVSLYLDYYDRGMLDSNDIEFCGPHMVAPLSNRRCQELLKKYYLSEVSDNNFSTLKTFLAVLAEQLLKFSKSTFFKVDNLKHMRGDDACGIRRTLFEALLKVSKDFTSRSVTTCRKQQNLSQQSLTQDSEKSTQEKSSALDMVERVEGMIQWEQSNHLIIVFRGSNSQSITAVYRDKNQIETSIADFLESQMIDKKKGLDDFKKMNQDELRTKLENIVCVGKTVESNVVGYVLTPDNILKMILIVLRIRASVPIIIMGETGCGKTSLVNYLANICGAKLHIKNIHAGVSESDIRSFIEEVEKEAKASESQTWVFLDEINTCEHLGFINDLVCHRKIYGRQLTNKLIFMAACNPYKSRPKERILTSGLEGKNTSDIYSKLVYRVFPLPEAMIDYVWDYGSLSVEDERVYIERMVKEKLQLKDLPVFIEQLVESQAFVREVEKNKFCVSLRDVCRCIRLVEWFHTFFTKRKDSGGRFKVSMINKKFETIARRHDKFPVIQFSVLALAHVYMSRLPDEKLRSRYREHMMDIFIKKGQIRDFDIKKDEFSAIVRMEAEDYLNRMELPPGTAKNAALRENVFVMLVSILNKIPLFVVGKPGCSKSLSIQLIRTNLRGPDSKDQLFKKLPQLYVLSYQGSESSTSEGITKVFEKAKSYVVKDDSVLPVVLLDEVGLAENSRHNPLKVLHSYLEPGHGQLPDVAVVGISNWALDAAKMNRAVHLSRPEPTVKDLIETGESLLTSRSFADKEMLKPLAEAYHEYEKNQSRPNFHGLRDYYALVKSVRGELESEALNTAIQRNFGGVPGKRDIFERKLRQVLKHRYVIPVCKLIDENIQDESARHLMLITNGDSGMEILKHNLSNQSKETTIIFGSNFEEDMCDDYNYRMLSRIILCMERDCVLILQGLERIYGSLYDMLNQNYSIVGGKKNCRVALGAFSNPMCQVNDRFRCVVLTEEEKLDLSDPPFLNRFEKQLLNFSSVLTEEQEKMVSELERWVHHVATIDSDERRFTESDMFVGYHKDTLPSLVHFHSNDKRDERSEDIIKACKEDLMWIATPDGVIRTGKCVVLTDTKEMQQLRDNYFEKPLHEGLSKLINTVMSNTEESSVGSLTVVMTYSTIHTNLSKCVNTGISCQIERLTAFKSEKQLTERINHFWLESKDNVLILQCKPELDVSHMLLARSIIEEKRNAYEKVTQNEKKTIHKHAFIVVHLQRGKNVPGPWQFNFLCGWKQVFLDMLEIPDVSLNEVYNESVTHLLESSTWPLKSFLESNLLSCFTFIKYTENQRSSQSILNICKNLLRSKIVSEAIEELVMRYLNTTTTTSEISDLENWQLTVACDRQSLINSSTLFSAMQQYVSSLVRDPLSRIVYFLERENAWPVHVFGQSGNEEIDEVWSNFMHNPEYFDITEIPQPKGRESYTLEGGCHDLSFPFIQVISGKFDAFKEIVLTTIAKLEEDNANLDDNGNLKSLVFNSQMERYSQIISKTIPEISSIPNSFCTYYTDDVLDLLSRSCAATSTRNQRTFIGKLHFLCYLKQRSVEITSVSQYLILLHMFTWSSKELLVDEIRLLECSHKFLRPTALETLAAETIYSSQLILPAVKNFCTISEQEKRAYSSEIADVDTVNGERFISTEEVDPEVVYNDPLQEEQPSFDEILVTCICKEMFSSQETVEKLHGGLASWVKNASLTLSQAFKINNLSPAFHFLRLCVDFATLALVPLHEKDCYLLYVLGTTADQLEPDYLDHPGAFEKVNKYLLKDLNCEKEDQQKYEAIQKFAASFYGRCLDTNLDSDCAHYIVEHVLSLEEPRIILAMSPVILRLLKYDQLDSPNIFIDIIEDEEPIDEALCIQKIDETLKHLFNRKILHYDSHVCVMICDLIERLMDFNSHYSFEDLKGSDCELLELVRNADRIMHEPDYCGIRFLSAVAFLRGFFTMFSRHVADRSDLLSKPTSSFSLLVNELKSLLHKHIQSCQQLTLLFLKQFYESDRHVFDIWKLCESLPFVKNIFVEDTPKADLNVFPKSKEYREAEDAFTKLCKSNEREMLVFLEKCSHSANHRFALLRLLGEMYVKRSERKLTDKEISTCLWFSSHIASLQDPVQQVIFRILGQKDFENRHMQISPESSSHGVQMALLIQHIVWILVSSGGNNVPMKQYLLNPMESKKSFIIANGDGRINGTLEQRESLNSNGISCDCGLRVVFRSNKTSIVCPRCQNEVKRSKSVPKNKISPTTGYAPVPLQLDACLDSMSPVAYHALNLIVHSCFYAAVALGFAAKDDLTSLIGKENPDEFCFNQIKNDIKYLATLCDCNQDVVIRTMHVVIEKCTELIVGKKLKNNTCSTHEQRVEFEKVFSDMTKDIFEGPHGLNKALMKYCKENGSAAEQLMEIDGYTDESENKNVSVKRLFRFKSKASFELFHASFLGKPAASQIKNRFLLIFFAKFDEIAMLRYLYDLLHWSRVVSANLTHRITRKDAESKPISSYVEMLSTTASTKRGDGEKYQSIFINFKTAWNNVLEFVNERQDTITMPRLNDQSPIGFCIPNAENGVYLDTAIKILVKIQNSILDEMMYLSSEHKPTSLTFLERNENCSAVMSSSLQDVQKREIIDFCWSDDLFMKYAQNNLEYGEGREIIYDFDNFEKVLANKIGFGKCYLEGSLNKLMFSKEFFHSADAMLEEIREIFSPAANITEDIRQDLLTIKERHIDEIQKVLQDLEIIIFLIKKNVKIMKISKEMTLEKYIELMPSLFPESFSLSLSQDQKRCVKLDQIAALYEALEDLLADGAIDSLPQKFCAPINEEMEKKLNNMKKGIILPKLHKALRRFVFRYLSSENVAADPETLLRVCLEKPSIWSPDAIPELSDIPRKFLLKHIHSIIKYLEAPEKVKIPNVKIPSTGTRKNAKRKIMANFSAT